MQTRLNIEEREKVFYYLTLNKSYREIGSLLGRSHTTIIREIKRSNKEGKYSPSRSEELSRHRYRKCGGRKKIDMNIDLFEEFFNRLFQKCYPEQISGHLKDKYYGNLQI